MRIVDLIDKKKKGLELTREEINYFISSLVDKSIPDYQTAAWLMAVWFQGMTSAETAFLTEAQSKNWRLPLIFYEYDKVYDRLREVRGSLGRRKIND